MDTSTLEVLMSICIGIGLAASCGFRVFVPLLVTSIAAMAGSLSLSSGFQWIGTWPAATAFAVATVLEIGGYYIPWLDNLLDTISTPAAVVAGIVAAAACIVDVNPLVQWSLAIMAGGGSAAVTKVGATGVRATSSVVTAGFGNFAVASIELATSLVLSILAVLLPAVAIIVVAGLLLFAFRFALRQRRSRHSRFADTANAAK